MKPNLMRQQTPDTLLSGLYAITPDMADTKALLAGVQSVLRGGCRLLQYRDKISSPNVQRERAQHLLSLCSESGAALIINDDLELALAVGAQGVHLGRGDGKVSVARQKMGSNAIIGVSCYADFTRAEQAQVDGASYVAFGAVFPSSTKPEAAHAPLSLIAQAKQSKTMTLPLCAIGGITLNNARSVLEAGADMVAVISDVFSAPDIAARAALFQTLFQEI